jgi:hypothetical protein
MKPFINLFIGGMFCVEIMSPFMLGYLNQNLRNHSLQSAEQKKPTTKITLNSSSNSNLKNCNAIGIISWKYVERTKSESSSSDSKNLAINIMALREGIK